LSTEYNKADRTTRRERKRPLEWTGAREVQTIPLSTFEAQAPAAPLRAPRRSGPRFWAKTALRTTCAARRTPLPGNVARCAPDATSGKCLFWAVFRAPRAPARFRGRQGTLGPAPVHFGRDQLPLGPARASSSVHHPPKEKAFFFEFARVCAPWRTRAPRPFHPPPRRGAAGAWGAPRTCEFVR
jgi:hypothetical protein